MPIFADLFDFQPWFDDHAELWRELIFIAATVTITWLASQLLRRLVRRVELRATARQSVWEAAIAQAVNRPLRVGAWIIGISMIARFLTRNHDLPFFTSAFESARDLAVILVIVWFLIGATRRIEYGLMHPSTETDYDPMAVDAVGKLARVVIVMLAILMAMPVFGFSISGILAFGGIGGIAIGFAAQGLVANLFGGLTVYASRPFQVGDVIIMPGTEVNGTVQRIGWRATRVMGANRQPFYVPNSMFNTAILVNYSRMDARRVQEPVRIRYADAERIPEIVKRATAMLKSYPGIRSDSALFRLDACDDFSFRFLLYAITSDTDYDAFVAMKEDLLLKIAAIIREAGAEIAVPTSTVRMPDELQIAGTLAPLPAPEQPAGGAS